MADIKVNSFEKTLGQVLNQKADDDGVIAAMELMVVGEPAENNREKNGQMEVRTNYAVFDPHFKLNFTITVPAAPQKDVQVTTRVKAIGIRGGVWHTGNKAGVWINVDRLEVVA